MSKGHTEQSFDPKEKLSEIYLEAASKYPNDFPRMREHVTLRMQALSHEARQLVDAELKTLFGDVSKNLHNMN